MSTRLKVMFALGRAGYSVEEYTVLADLVVWILEQPGETRGWITVTAEVVERYDNARMVMATPAERVRLVRSA